MQRLDGVGDTMQSVLDRWDEARKDRPDGPCHYCNRWRSFVMLHNCLHCGGPPFSPRVDMFTPCLFIGVEAHRDG